MRKRTTPRSYRMASSGTAVFDLGHGPLIEETFTSLGELNKLTERLQRKHRAKPVRLVEFRFKTKVVPVK